MPMYPDAPGHRLAYDLLGGTQVWSYLSGGGNLTQYGSTSLNNLNNEESANNDVISNGDITLDLFTEFHFPMAVDVFGVWVAGFFGTAPSKTIPGALFDDIAVAPAPARVQIGPWSGSRNLDTLAGHYNTWRETSEMAIFSAEGVWGLRGRMDDAGLAQTNRIRQLHIYAAPNPAANPERVVLIDNDTGLELDSVLDWGDISRGDVHSHTFQVKNNSATQNALNVTLGFNSLNSGVASWHEYRDGVGSWSTSLSLGNLGPGATYPNDIDVRVTVASNAGLGPRSNRMTIGVTGWSST